MCGSMFVVCKLFTIWQVEMRKIEIERRQRERGKGIERERMSKLLQSKLSNAIVLKVNIDSILYG